MCEQASAVDVLRDIPFRVAALEQMFEQGSYNRALARCVYDSVRTDVEWVIARIEAGAAKGGGDG